MKLFRQVPSINAWCGCIFNYFSICISLRLYIYILSFDCLYIITIAVVIALAIAVAVAIDVALLVEQNSVYGTALVMLQFARSTGWSANVAAHRNRAT